MTEVLQPDPGNSLRTFRSAARRSGLMLAALAGTAMLASPLHGALGAQATQVRNIDDPGRIPYQSTVVAKAGAQFEFSFSAVPAGHRLVIQHISSAGLTFTFTPQRHVQVKAFGGDGTTGFFAQFSLQSTAFDQPILLYVDAGDSPFVVVEADNGTDPALSGGSLTLTGYLLDCNAAPCTPIAP